MRLPLSVTQRLFFIFSLLFFSTTVARADVLTFEDRSDSESVTTQYSNLVFSNATAIQAGISLNETSFPPRSGITVLLDDGGPMSISFTAPVSSISAYFTYSTQLTLVAFDVTNNPIATLTSAFNNNTADGGDPGSSPNEVVIFSFASGISRITITGSPTGESFVMDDLTFTSVDATAPEPSTLLLMSLGLSALATKWCKKKLD
jgi:hypothetical protein